MTPARAWSWSWPGSCPRGHEPTGGTSRSSLELRQQPINFRSQVRRSDAHRAAMGSEGLGRVGINRFDSQKVPGATVAHADLGPSPIERARNANRHAAADVAGEFREHLGRKSENRASHQIWGRYRSCLPSFSRFGGWHGTGSCSEGTGACPRLRAAAKGTGTDCFALGASPSHDTSRIAWGKLLARVGEEFPLEYPNCGGDIRIDIHSL